MLVDEPPPSRARGGVCAVAIARGMAGDDLAVLDKWLTQRIPDGRWAYPAKWIADRLRTAYGIEAKDAIERHRREECRCPR